MFPGNVARAICFFPVAHDMFRRAAVGTTVFAVQFFGSVPGCSAHFAPPPCAGDEVMGEIQDSSGTVCAPRCAEGSYACPVDLPSGATAQPQCMLKDVDQRSFCGLLCQVDGQCPSGARCKTLKQAELSVCVYPFSFADWSRQGETRKLVIGWPSAAGQGSGVPATSFQIAKTYQSLQALKSKYAVDDGDADMLTLKEFLASLSTSVADGGAGSPAARAPSGSGPVSDSSASLDVWGHDLRYVEGNFEHGIPGLEKEFDDTIWNIEHIEKRGVATMLLRGVWVVCLFYIVGGAFIKHQMMGVRGVDVIPHIGFWREYPSLVADGIMYSKVLAGLEQPTGNGAFGGGGRGDLLGVSAPIGGGGAGGFEPML